MSSRRGYEGPMDWEHENPQFDASSPFTQFSQRPAPGSPLKLPPKPFAHLGARQAAPFRPQSFSNSPQRSLFGPNLSRQNTAPPLRNPSFTTPQARGRFDDSVMSDMSAIDDSPAMTEVSVADTPDVDRSDLMDSLSISTPDHTTRNLFSEKKSGKGELARPPKIDFHARDKIRKRKRIDKDRDIGTTRSRLPGGRDEDDSDYESDYSGGGGSGSGKRGRPKQDMGWLHYILGSVSANPHAPIIMSYYLQLLVDAFLSGMLVWVAWGIYTSARGEVLYSSEKARLEKLAEIDVCSRDYLLNKCAPIAQRLPALEDVCNKWETCMNQDPNSVAGVKASAGHLADIINEFTSALSWKSIIFALSIIFVVLIANNIAFSRFRRNVRDYNHQPAPTPAPSHPALGFPGMMSPEKSNQAYIFAPIGHTPKHIRRAFFQSPEDTDTDASPDPRLLPAPRTPSRRSPSKGERGRSHSPSKRSPTKGW